MTASRQSWTLVVLSVAQFLTALDYSISYLALPSIAAELRMERALAQWVISAYAVLFAGFLVVGGRFADRVGPKRPFVVAVVMFGLASAAGGLAGDGTLLLAARAGQGLSAALLQPAVLGLIGTTFAAGPARSRALAVWGSVGAAGLAAGAILGGLLTSMSWRLTFWINVPLTLLCAVGAAVVVRDAADRGAASRVPLLASVLGTATVVALALGLTLSADQGWLTVGTLGSVGLGIVLLAVFVLGERGSRNVLIEPVLRGISTLRTGAVASALSMASVGSEFYLLTLLFQQAKGFDPLQAGLAFLPLALMVTAGSTAAGRAIGRLGARRCLAVGFAMATVGLGWLALTLQGDSYVRDLLPGLLLSGFGHGAIFTSMFTLGTHDVPPAQQGTAGALLTTSQYLAGALTVAVLTLVLGPTPGDGQFRAAFVLTAAAAVAGVLLSGNRLDIAFPGGIACHLAAACRKDQREMPETRRDSGHG